MVTFSCESCSAINATNAKFCSNCGASLVNFSASNTDARGNKASHSHDLDSGALVSEFVFAGFWKRVVAYIIDGALFTLVFVLVLSTSQESLEALQSGDQEVVNNLMNHYLYFYLAWWLYFALMETSSLQGTLGKKLLGIKVVDEQGQGIGFFRATLRHFSAILSSIILSIGYLMSAFTKRKQTLHDMVASCLVVNKRYDASQIKVANENPGRGMSTGGIIAVIFLVLLIPIGGIIAAIAIPAYHDYTLRANVVQAISSTQSVKTAFIEHASQTGYWPNTFESAGLEESDFNSEKYRVILAGEGGYQILFIKPEALASMRLNFSPELNSDGSYRWKCFSDDIRNGVLPIACRSK